MTRRLLALPALTALLLVPGAARAGTLTAQGDVTVIDDAGQLQGVIATASFDEAEAGAIPLDQYAGQGMLFHEGPLSAALPGVMTGGGSFQPIYVNDDSAYFPDPIAGGAVAEGSWAMLAGVASFSETVTQFGLTGGTNGTMYLTVWDQQGAMIGQVTWSPSDDAAFVGVDTQGVAIGLLAYGNDNLWAGASYGAGGLAIHSDTWIWASGEPCQADADCPADENLCTDDLCVDGYCVHPFNSDPCDDGDACTGPDLCAEGVCTTAEIDCDDQNLCSLDSCDPVRGCVYDWTRGCCVVEEDCGAGEQCNFGSNTCVPDTGSESTGDGDTSGESTGDGDTSGESTDDGDTSGESTGDTGPGESGDEIGEGEDSGTGSAPAVGEASCACTSASPDRGAGLGGLALLALLGLGLRRRS